MKRVVVLGTCILLKDWAPEGARNYSDLMPAILARQGTAAEVVGLSMAPSTYRRLGQVPQVHEPFDYLVMEITSAWIVIRTIESRIAHSVPKPLRGLCLSATRQVVNIGGGPQEVFGRQATTLRARLTRWLQRPARWLIRPRSLADADEFERYIDACAALCEARGARLLVFISGSRSEDPRHQWARDLIDDLVDRIRARQEIHGFPVVSLVRVLSVHPNPEMMPDGLHPNQAGHVRFASEVVGALNEMEKTNSVFWREAPASDIELDPSLVWSLPAGRSAESLASVR
jgi:hypothetical protein